MPGRFSPPSKSLPQNFLELDSYIDVILVGTKTVGKQVGSVTLYDSPNYGREGANPNHTWAMQPIVLEEQNKLGVNDQDGFVLHLSQISISTQVTIVTKHFMFIKSGCTLSYIV